MSRIGEVLIYDTSQPPFPLDSPAPMRDDYAMTMTDALRATHYAINTAMIHDDDAAFDALFALLFDDATLDTDDPAILDFAARFRALNATDRAAFYLDYDACPLHECDLEICADDDIAECAEMRYHLDIEIAAARAALAIFPRPS